jgi:3-dehydroquinate dehydratase/shikimate dehydrogenase
MPEPAADRVCAVVRESNGADVAEAVSKASRNVGFAELRLDYVRPADLTVANVSEWIEKANCPVILTLRRKPNGGEFKGSEAEQMEVLCSLLKAGASFIDLEIETIESYLQGNLARIKDGNLRWIASYHNFQRTPEDLDAVYRRLIATNANVVKIATVVQAFGDNFRLLELIKRAYNSGLESICVGMGELGTVTRMLAPAYGSILTYGSLGKGQESAPGQFTVEELKNLYEVNQIDSSTELYGVLGYPVGHSLSPHIHNAAFRRIGFNARYLPLAIQDLTDFGPHLRKFAGFSVTIPHKVKILDFVNAVDETVKLTGAANTLVKRGDQMVAFNTDVDGIRSALQAPFKQNAGRVTLLGTGGAARAAGWALKQEGCSVTVLARDSRKAKCFAEEFGFAHDVLNRAEHYGGDLLINATSVGMSPQVDKTPIPRQALNYRYVFDMVYNPLETRLMREAHGRAEVISGVEMFLAQGARQFELWTGRPAPLALMRDIVLEKLRQ